MNRFIEITVALDGQTNIETKGFTGSDCREASRFIEQSLGKQLNETMTPEFHASAETTNQLHQPQEE